jgi:erythromycin esterase-like protein
VTATAARIIQSIQRCARPVRSAPSDYDEIVARAEGARLVLLGEATHGTHEFYRERALITRRLIEEQGFAGVAAEADWPDAWRVSRYVRGVGDDPDAADALAGFRRFPTWMWRNADVLDFVGWLRSHNERIERTERRAGFWGIDLYSLYTSIEEVIRFLDHSDPAAAARARDRYACFEDFHQSSEAYAVAAGTGVENCEDEVVAQLIELQRQYHRQLAADQPPLNIHHDDDLFYAEQNARVARNAEEYYRSMFRGRVASWNLRDGHMADTVDELLAYLDRRLGRSRLVIWAHNSHVGDARATEMHQIGELNLGQLLRERYGGDCFSVGFSTFEGTVTAASDWDREAERKVVRPALSGSYEALFHACGLPRFLLPMDHPEVVDTLSGPRLQRAIGVVYRPEIERVSHYLTARLPDQYDFVVHVDATRAVEPLERSGVWNWPPEPPETYPSAL